MSVYTFFMCQGAYDVATETVAVEGYAYVHTTLGSWNPYSES